MEDGLPGLVESGFHNHGDRVRPQELGFWTPDPFMAEIYGFELGVALTTETNWDDPASEVGRSGVFGGPRKLEVTSLFCLGGIDFAGETHIPRNFIFIVDGHV